jgi:phosphopantothenoylcysteine decarboxylase/phosphopantothenate--cysteine ligase
MLRTKRVLIVIGGGIAAYKVLELIRRLRDEGVRVRVVMTRAAHEFVTPVSVAAIAGEPPHTELFDADGEHDVGHIRLARDTDLIVIAPATADLLAKLANGLADDLASAILLATDKPVLAAPAMNPSMWLHPATRRNVAALSGYGVRFVGPNSGAMAEAGESGLGRMAEPQEILAAIKAALGAGTEPLAGKHVLVTAGPTHEPLDPVRYLANRSSGKQGFAIAAAAAELGARVTLVTGPVALADPPGVSVVHVETAREMLAAVEAALPADAAVMTAAVADWRSADEAPQKIKKARGGKPPTLSLAENPDILATLAKHQKRPKLLIGFAAETENLIANARTKLAAKGCDWIVANDVSEAGGAMGGEENAVAIVTTDGVEYWPRLSKQAVGERLAARIADALGTRRASAAE